MQTITVKMLLTLPEFLQKLKGKKVAERTNLILRTTHSDSTDTVQEMYQIAKDFCCGCEKDHPEHGKLPFFFYANVVTDIREIAISISNHVGSGMSLWEISIEKYQSNKNDAKGLVQSLNLPNSFTVTDEYDKATNKTSICFSFTDEELPSGEWLSNLFITLADLV